MTVPPISTALGDVDPAEAARRSRRSTLMTLGVLAVLIALILVLTPVKDSASDRRLTTAKYGANNARLLSALAQRLGWPIRTLGVPLTGTLDTAVVYAVFGGPTPMSTSERTSVLTAVEHGAGLLLTPGTPDAAWILSRLGLQVGTAGTLTATPLGPCSPATDPLAMTRSRQWMSSFADDSERTAEMRGRYPRPRDLRTLISVAVTTGRDAPDSTSMSGDSTGGLTERRPAVLAFTHGRGRVVAVADPDLLRTDQLRNCAAGPALGIVRGLEYLSDGGRRELRFSEYYQGVRDDGPGVVVWEWLRWTGPGRALLTLMAAGVLVLLARGRRTLAPVTRLRDERRSALEHVEALALAWQAVRGTRTVARMLSRGIRRRHAAGRWRALDDTAFLSALAERHPVIADDAARIIRAIDSPETPHDLPALRHAAARIDAECLAP